MRIIVTTSTFPENIADPVPRFVLDQVRALHQGNSECEIHVLIPYSAFPATKNPSTLEKATHIEHRYHYFPVYKLEKLCGRGMLPSIRENPLRVMLIPFYFVAQFRSLSRLCKDVAPDLIYAHWFVPQGLVAHFVSIRCGIPYMFTSHSSDVQVLRRIPFGRVLLDRCLSRAKQFTAVSKVTAKKMKSFFSPDHWEDRFEKKLHIIPMGVDCDLFIPLPSLRDSSLRKLGVCPEKRSILAMGRLVPKKGFSTLIESYALLPVAVKENYQLVIAGDGYLSDALSQQVRDLGLQQHIIFVGYVHGDLKLYLLDHAAAVVIPSTTQLNGDAEGLPVVFMEAIAAGKIVIASDASGLGEYLDDCGGILVPEKDANAIAKAIEYVDSLSKTQVSDIRSAALMISKQFSWPSISHRYFEIINMVLEQHESYDSCAQ